MKPTLGLSADLIREMKLRAAHEGRKLRDVATEVFRRGLMSENPPTSRRRVKLPLIHCGQPGTSLKELDAGQVADLLLQQEIESSREAAGR
jgi:plasmid stability protein